MYLGVKGIEWRTYDASKKMKLNGRNGLGPMTFPKKMNHFQTEFQTSSIFGLLARLICKTLKDWAKTLKSGLKDQKVVPKIYIEF